MKRPALALALLFAGSPIAAADEEAEHRGEALLTARCASCHAVGRTGESREPAAPAFRTLGRRYKIEALEEALGEGLITGHADMPEVNISPEDIGDVIAYLNAIQER
jgi:cytochrome c